MPNSLSIQCDRGPIAGIHTGTVGDGSLASEMFLQTDQGIAGRKLLVSSPVLMISRDPKPAGYRELTSKSFKSYHYIVVSNSEVGDVIQVTLQLEGSDS